MEIIIITSDLIVKLWALIATSLILEITPSTCVCLFAQYL